MNDLRLYGILYQYHMVDCKEKALRLFEKGLAMGEKNAPEVYHQIERQRMLLRSQVGENEKIIENQKALEIFRKAEKEFEDQALLYAYGGDLYKRLGKYDEAFSCWDKAFELDSEMTAVLWSEGACYEECGEYQRAYEVWCLLIAWLEERGYEAEAKEPRRLAERCKEMMSL